MPSLIDQAESEWITTNKGAIEYKLLESHILSFCKVTKTIQEHEEKVNNEIVNIDFSTAFETVLDYHEVCIRKICGMPKVDVEGVFTFDRFYFALWDIVGGKNTVDNVIPIFLSWKNKD